MHLDTDLNWYEIWRDGDWFTVYDPHSKCGRFGSRQLALEWVAARPDPKHRGDRGPLRHARHIAKCLLAIPDVEV